MPKRPAGAAAAPAPATEPGTRGPSAQRRDPRGDCLCVRSSVRCLALTKWKAKTAERVEATTSLLESTPQRPKLTGDGSGTACSVCWRSAAGKDETGDRRPVTRFSGDEGGG